MDGIQFWKHPNQVYIIVINEGSCNSRDSKASILRDQPVHERLIVVPHTISVHRRFVVTSKFLKSTKPNKSRNIREVDRASTEKIPCP